MDEKTVEEALKEVSRRVDVCSDSDVTICSHTVFSVLRSIERTLGALAREKADKAVCAACAREPHQMHAPLEHQRDRRETVAYWEASFKEMRDGYDKVSAERDAAKDALAQMTAEWDTARGEIVQLKARASSWAANAREIERALGFDAEEGMTLAEARKLKAELDAAKASAAEAGRLNRATNRDCGALEAEVERCRAAFAELRKASTHVHHLVENCSACDMDAILDRAEGKS